MSRRCAENPRKIVIVQGDLKRVYHRWREQLMHHLAHLEAWIDFGEEEAIEENVFEQGRLRIR
jgi:tRNA U34 5-carboxymethylaminomethyl modifying GTPase MnmE/TrmE